MSDQQTGCTHPSLGISSLRDDGSAARWGCVMCGTEFVPKRKFVGLTNQELIDLTAIHSGGPLYCAIEAKLREKNA